MAPKRSKSADSTSDSRNKERVHYSESAVRHNAALLEYTRTWQSAAAGTAAGLLGLTGFAGFIFYFATVLIQAALWQYHAAGRWAEYFTDSWLPITYSLVGGLFTYVLFWVFLYGMVHVY